MNEANLHLIEELERELRMEEKAARRQKREAKRKRCNPVHVGVIIMLVASMCILPAAAAQTVPGLSLLGTYSPYDTVINKDILDAVYPVGKIYISTQNISPAAQFGGTWAAVGEGRVLIGEGGGYSIGTQWGTPNPADNGTSLATFTGAASGVGGTMTLTGTASGIGAGQPINGTVSNVGGAISGITDSITLALTNLPSHSHTMAHTHGIAHYHSVYGSNIRTGWPDEWADTHGTGGENTMYWRGNITLSILNRVTGTTSLTSGSTAPGTSGSTGSGSPFTVNGVGTAAGLSGNVSVDLPADGLGGGTASVTGTVSGLSSPAGAASASGNVSDKVMQPYLVVYMWRRTA